jgi:ABC-type lipoprotein release transport system permease subunit
MFLIIGGILGVILAAVYTTLYGRFYRRLPPSLQTEKVDLTWRDLRIPGVLFTVLMALGLLLSS